MLETLTHEDFEGRVGETFAVEAATEGETRTLALTLRSVDALPRPDGDKGRAPFSLRFTEPGPDHFPQQTVAFHDPEKGTYALFVVPLGPGEDGMHYEAVFT